MYNNMCNNSSNNNNDNNNDTVNNNDNVVQSRLQNIAGYRKEHDGRHSNNVGENVQEKIVKAFTQSLKMIFGT